MEPAVIALILLALFVLTPLLIFALVMRGIARSNRVSPDIPTLAPLTWTFLPERPARLHRRLRRAVLMARIAAAGHVARGGSGLGAIPELVGDLERRACVIDSELVVASRSRGPLRWSMLNDLEHQVYEVDGLATRIAGLATAWSSASSRGGDPARLDAISERLNALESALQEVSAISFNHPSWTPQASTQPIPHLRPVQGDKGE
jgi:hypothetical protein